jgi:hypothetical protein
MRIPVLGIGQLSKSPFVTAKALQNMYAEQRPVGEKSMMVAYQTPGQDLFCDFGATPCRGGMEFDALSVAYVVHRGTFYEVNNAGTKTNRGSLLTTSGRVSMADNGTQVMIVDGTYGYIYNTSTNVFAQIVDADFPANAVTVTFLAGRFIVNVAGSSRFYVSDLYDGTAWTALNFANAETSPDPIVAVLASNGQLILLGTRTTEYWGNSGALDFAFALIQGTATEWGLAATWSLAKYDNSYTYLVKNRMGQVMVATINGYLPKPVSNVDVSALINDYSSAADASAYSYMLGQHPMYVINFPTAGKSWLYDGTTNIWTQLKSSGLTRHNAEFSFSLINKTIVADYSSGQLFVLTNTALTDNGASIERSITSETVASQDQDRITVDKFRVDIEVGVGVATGQGSNPQIGLEVSRDNGKTWGAQMWTTMGAIGDYALRAEWRRLGTAFNYVFRLTVTDPVPLVMVSACINPTD